MRTRSLLAALLALSVAGAAYAQAASTAPATAPATSAATSAPASQPVTADFSSPKATMTTINNALDAGQFTLVRSAFNVSSAQKRGFDALLNTIESARVFEDAFRAKFGAEKAKELGLTSGLGGEELAARTDAVAKAPVTVKDDTATMQMAIAPGQPPANLEFHKIQGQWKLDAGALVRSDDPEYQRMLPVVEKMAQAYRDAADEVKTDKVTTVEQAEQAVLKRVVPLQAEAAKLGAATEPGAAETAPAPTIK